MMMRFSTTQRLWQVATKAAVAESLSFAGTGRGCVEKQFQAPSANHLPIDPAPPDH